MTYEDNPCVLDNYLKELATSHPLSAEQECDLAVRMKQGDRSARNELIEANLRFVVSTALKYKNRGVPLTDLISAGNVGLITAAERFDETRGYKFISYAV
jgi:RNA polymerase primary sigma factor